MPRFDSSALQIVNASAGEVVTIDERFPVPTHHLRRLYPDPITGASDWTLVPTPSGTGIMGVASSSQRAPIKRQGFEPIDDAFKDSDCYCSWQFIYYPNRFSRAIAPGGSTTTPPGSPTAPAPLTPATPTTSTP